jgi:hypothetical protein
LLNRTAASTLQFARAKGSRMSNHANAAGHGPAVPAIITLLTIAIGVALYMLSGTEALYLHAICAPFAVLFLWLSWSVPTLDERYARRAQGVRPQPKAKELTPAHSH